MGKIAVWFAGAGILFFIAAATIESQISECPWYLWVLWIGAAVAGGMCALTGGIYAFQIARLHIKPITFRGQFRCSYWKGSRHLEVTAWFDDRSASPSFLLGSTACLGSSQVNLTLIGRPDRVYMISGTGFAGPNDPLLVTFGSEDVDLDDPKEAAVTVRATPAPGLWRRAEQTQTVAIQLFEH